MLKKLFIIYSRDSILSEKKLSYQIRQINKWYKKILVIIFYPMGYVLAKIKRYKKHVKKGAI